MPADLLPKLVYRLVYKNSCDCARSCAFTLASDPGSLDQGMSVSAATDKPLDVFRRFALRISSSRLRAFTTLLAVLSIHTILYVGYQLYTHSGDDGEALWADALAITPGIPARLLANREKLSQFFAADQLQDWIKQVETTNQAIFDEITGYRCLANTSTNQFLQRRNSSNVLLNFDYSCQLEGSQALPRPSGVKYLLTLLGQAPFHGLSDEGLAELVELKRMLLVLAESEHAAEQKFYAGLSGMVSNVSFDWLYHDDAGWVLELVFWSIYGVLASSLAWLIKQYRQTNYDGRLFLLFIPRMFLAPILSVIITAFIASGESGYQIDLQNLPAFLVFAFLMGFNSESLTKFLRDIFNRMFAESDATAIGSAAAGTPQLTPAPGKPPRTWLDQWEESLRAGARKILRDKYVEKKQKERGDENT